MTQHGNVPAPIQQDGKSLTSTIAIGPMPLSTNTTNLIQNHSNSTDMTMCMICLSGSEQATFTHQAISTVEKRFVSAFRWLFNNLFCSLAHYFAGYCNIVNLNVYHYNNAHIISMQVINGNASK